MRRTRKGAPYYLLPQKLQKKSPVCNILIFCASLQTEGNKPKKIMEDIHMFSWGLNIASGVLDICGEGKAKWIVDTVNKFVW